MRVVLMLVVAAGATWQAAVSEDGGGGEAGEAVSGEVSGGEAPGVAVEEGQKGESEKLEAEATQRRAMYPGELILVSDEEGWLAAAAGPVAARMWGGRRVAGEKPAPQGDAAGETPAPQRGAGAVPLLVTLSAPPTKEAEVLVKQVNPRHITVLAIEADPALPAGLKRGRTEVVVTGREPTRAGLVLAQRFWEGCEEVVIAPVEDPGSVILGAMLASSLGVPVIPVEAGSDGDELSEALGTLGVQQVLVAARTVEPNSPWAPTLRQRTENLAAGAIYERMLERVGVEHVRTIVLTRVWSSEPMAKRSSWLAPYVSMVRGAPVVVCDTADGREAEDRVYSLIRHGGLMPRSVTILGDTEAIGTIPIKDEAVLGEFEVSIEPCSGPTDGGAAAMGVGRIGGREMKDASVILARGYARERLVGGKPAEVLMVANPKTDYSPLPFCETVSRATSEEFKNAGLEVTEFYQQAWEKEIAAAAERAGIIIYEGHISDQQLFPTQQSFGHPIFYPEGEPDYPTEEGYISGYEASPPPSGSEVGTDGPAAEEAGADVRAGDADDTRMLLRPEDGEPVNGTYPRSAEAGEEGGKPASDWGPRKLPPIERLEGMPLVIMQSCHSLEDELLRKVFETGGVGLLGTVANIHSASGSAYVKAFCDGLLYRGDTLGEALRDARNYFLCLAALKAERGHKEQAKVYRVALGFCLRGDPELRIPGDGAVEGQAGRLHHNGVRESKHQPVAAKMEGSDTVVISIPGRRLAESRTEKYFVRMYPGSETAGIVKRLKDEPARRIVALYYFRLAVPEGFDPAKYSRLVRPNEDSVRAVFLADPLGRFVHVVYIPENDRKREEVSLQFVK